MARIPRNIVNPGTFQPGSTGVRIDPKKASQAGVAQIQEANTNAAFIDNELKKMNEQFTNNYFLTEAVNLQEQAINISQESLKNVPADGQGYTQLVKEQFRGALDNSLANAPTAQARNKLMALGASISGKLYANSFSEELKMSQTSRLNKIEASSNILANRVFNNPESYKESFVQNNTLIDSLQGEGLDPRKINAIREQTNQQLISNSIKGLNVQDPMEALKVLQNKDVVKNLTPERYSALSLSVLSNIKRLQKEQVKQQNRAIYTEAFAQGMPLNSKDKEAQKVADEAFSTFLDQNSKTKDINQFYNNLLNHTQQNPSVMSKQMTDLVTTQLKYGSIEQKVAASVLINKLDENPNMRSELERLVSKDDRETAETVSRLMNAGIPAGDAVAQATDLLKPANKAEIETKTEIAKNLYKDVEESLIADVHGKEKIMKTAKEVFISKFVQTGDVAEATTKTQKELERKYSTSNINNNREEYFRVNPEQITGLSKGKLQTQLHESITGRKIILEGPQPELDTSIPENNNEILEKDLEKLNVPLASEILFDGTLLKGSKYTAEIVEDEKTSRSNPSYKIRVTDEEGNSTILNKRILFYNDEAEAAADISKSRLLKLREDRDLRNRHADLNYQGMVKSLMENVGHKDRIKLFNQLERTNNE